MAKVVGIGGVFLPFQGKEQEVMDWYEKYLGLDMTAYGSGFTEGKQLVLLSFSKSDDLKAPYLNLRVDDIDALMNDLKALDLEILHDVQEYPYGKFARFVDPFGNAIELWEVYEEAYLQMVKQEIVEYKKKQK